jgi:hypothetical protein
VFNYFVIARMFPDHNHRSTHCPGIIFIADHHSVQYLAVMVYYNEGVPTNFPFFKGQPATYMMIQKAIIKQLH